MIYLLSSQCDSFNPYYNKNLNIEEMLYESEIKDLKKQKDNLIKDSSSDFKPKSLNPSVGILKYPAKKIFVEKYYDNLPYNEEFEDNELEKLQNILKNEIADEIKQEKDWDVIKLTVTSKEDIRKKNIEHEEKELIEARERKEKKITDGIEMVKKQHLEEELKKEAILEDAELKKIQEMQEIQENDIEEDIIKNKYIEDKNIQESLMEDALIEFKKDNRFIRSKKSKSISPTRELLNNEEAIRLKNELSINDNSEDMYDSEEYVCDLLGMSSIFNKKDEKISNKSLLNEINEEVDYKYQMKGN